MLVDENSSKTYPVKSGVPQGSILGLKVFLLHINNLLDDFICNIAVYAYDATLYYECDLDSNLRQQQELACRADSDLRDTTVWDRKWFVDSKTGKTQLVSFDSSNNCGAINVKIGISDLGKKSSVKMPGLSFSSKLD